MKLTRLPDGTWMAEEDGEEVHGYPTQAEALKALRHQQKLRRAER